MKQSERMISAVATVALGIILIVLRATFIEVLMTIAGLILIVFGIIDLMQKMVPPAVFKIVVGVIVIICGWAIVEAVLYVVAAILLIAGILLLYDKIRNKSICPVLWQTVCEYAVPVVFVLIGVFLLFNQGNTVSWVFIASGVFTIFEGGLLLVNSFYQE